MLSIPWQFRLADKLEEGKMAAEHQNGSGVIFFKQHVISHSLDCYIVVLKFCLGEQVVEEALLDSGVSKEEVDWLVLHQANQRILDSAAQRLGISGDKVPSTADDAF